MKIDNNPLVEFVDVQKTYDGEELVVKNLNLKIMPGEFLTMLGPSGSGKTTCLMMIAGFEAPTHGKVMLGDIELNNVPPVTADLRKSSALPAFALNRFENEDIINLIVSLRLK